MRLAAKSGQIGRNVLRTFQCVGGVAATVAPDVIPARTLLDDVAVKLTANGFIAVVSLLELDLVFGVHFQCSYLVRNNCPTSLVGVFVVCVVCLLLLFLGLTVWTKSLAQRPSEVVAEYCCERGD